MKFLIAFALSMMLSSPMQATPKEKNITTNEVLVHNAPAWLKTSRIEKITARIQHKLEWTTRKINVYWYNSQADFQKVHRFGLQALAVTQHPNGDSVIHMGPGINNDNFDGLFGHELVHVIIFQKYKGSIPKWLEEGLANHLSTSKKVDYKWLAAQPMPKNVLELAHPFSESSASAVLYRYKASQAFAEMLDKKCDLDNLIRLSVERKMEDYIARYCEIKDLNLAFKDWVKKKAK